MSKKAESAYQALGWAGAGVAAGVSWVQSWNTGAVVTGATAVIGLAVWAYSRIKLTRSETANKIWFDKRQLDRDDKLAEAAAEREIQEKSTELKERTLKVDLRIKAAHEKAEARSLSAKVRELEQKLADQAHVIDQYQTENARRDNHDIERDRQLHEALTTVERLTKELGQVRGQVADVEAQAESNARRLGKVEQSGANAVVQLPDEGGAPTGPDPT